MILQLEVLITLASQRDTLQSSRSFLAYGLEMKLILVILVVSEAFAKLATSLRTKEHYGVSPHSPFCPKNLVSVTMGYPARHMMQKYI